MQSLPGHFRTSASFPEQHERQYALIALMGRKPFGRFPILPGYRGQRSSRLPSNGQSLASPGPPEHSRHLRRMRLVCVSFISVPSPRFLRVPFAHLHDHAPAGPASRPCERLLYAAAGQDPEGWGCQGFFSFVIHSNPPCPLITVN